MVGPYLNRSGLYYCVTLSKDWFRVFTPHLWKHVQLRCPREPQSRASSEQPTQDQKDSWFQQLKRSIKAGGLDRNGQFVHTFDCRHYEAVELLASRGVTCTGLRVLKLGPYPAPDLPSFKSRKLVYMLDEKNYDFIQLLEVIPESIVYLELKEWNSNKGTREYDRDLRAMEYQSGGDSDSDFEDRNGQGEEARFIRLKELGFYDYAFDYNKRTMEYIIKNSPSLELLSLQDTYLTHSSQAALKTPFSLLSSNHAPVSEKLGRLSRRKAGWMTLGLPTTWSSRDEDEFGPLSTAAILKHAPTLENVRLDWYRKFSRAAADELFRAASNIQRLDARVGESVADEKSN
ncbi:hypothetical protein BG015_006293 [Linnemannia schmuckeri]|uniref:Uncharacterized protein n=1 Tax=Linnemannia schmuckeri TaxID=64567 RepID=A0A9P5RZU9_9FUNG|nr:hypothetical protein BG015_006293 [Linnemannia schmuckeri]